MAFLVKGFAPIGNLEFWNIGIMGSNLRLVMAYGPERIMELWV
jgi:hypothetical protein